MAHLDSFLCTHPLFPALAVALSKEYRKFQIIQKSDISSNTRFFRVALQSKETRLGLPVGDSVVVTAMLPDAAGQLVRVSRPYTPISSDDDLGVCDFCIKVYPQGKMTQHLDSLRVGDLIEMKGPSGSIQYQGAGVFTLGRDTKPFKHIACIAGGSGITPVLQVMRAVTKEVAAGKTGLPTVSLVFGNVAEEDILMRAELDKMATQTNFRVHYTLDKPPAKGWKGSKGFVTSAMIAENLPAASADTLVLLCGPEGMVRSAEAHLEALGHQVANIRRF